MQYDDFGSRQRNLKTQILIPTNNQGDLTHLLPTDTKASFNLNVHFYLVAAKCNFLSQQLSTLNGSLFSHAQTQQPP